MAAGRLGRRAMLVPTADLRRETSAMTGALRPAIAVLMGVMARPPSRSDVKWVTVVRHPRTTRRTAMSGTPIVRRRRPMGAVIRRRTTDDAGTIERAMPNASHLRRPAIRRETVAKPTTAAAYATAAHTIAVTDDRRRAITPAPALSMAMLRVLRLATATKISDASCRRHRTGRQS